MTVNDDGVGGPEVACLRAFDVSAEYNSWNDEMAAWTSRLSGGVCASSLAILNLDPRAESEELLCLPAHEALEEEAPPPDIASAFGALDLPPLEKRFPSPALALEPEAGAGEAAGEGDARAHVRVTWGMECAPHLHVLESLIAHASPAAVSLDARSARSSTSLPIQSIVWRAMTANCYCGIATSNFRSRDLSH